MYVKVSSAAPHVIIDRRGNVLIGYNSKETLIFSFPN